MSGAVGVQAGTPSVIEVQFPRALLGDPTTINVAAVSVGRGRVHTAGDVLGSDVSPTDWSEPVTLESFVSMRIK